MKYGDVKMCSFKNENCRLYKITVTIDSIIHCSRFIHFQLMPLTLNCNMINLVDVGLSILDIDKHYLSFADTAF